MATTSAGSGVVDLFPPKVIVSDTSSGARLDLPRGNFQLDNPRAQPFALLMRLGSRLAPPSTVVCSSPREAQVEFSQATSKMNAGKQTIYKRTTEQSTRRMRDGNKQPENEAGSSAKRRCEESKVLRVVWSMRYDGACTMVTYDLMEDQSGMAVAGRAAAWTGI